MIHGATVIIQCIPFYYDNMSKEVMTSDSNKHCGVNFPDKYLVARLKYGHNDKWKHQSCRNI